MNEYDPWNIQLLEFYTSDYFDKARHVNKFEKCHLLNIDDYSS
jgi:hypothetical protein